MSELLHTNKTFVCFLVNVHQQVLFQRCFVLEYFLTSTTIKGSLASMDQNVAVQSSFLREGLVTHVALVRSVAGVT